jgi:hypothetical protein
LKIAKKINIKKQMVHKKITSQRVITHSTLTSVNATLQFLECDIGHAWAKRTFGRKESNNFNSLV